MPMRAVLEQVHDAARLTVPAIARRLFITRQGVQVLVDESKRAGYLESRPNREHRRSHLIVLTERGRAAFDRIHADELHTLDQIAAGLDPQDVDACVRVLDHPVSRPFPRLTRSVGETTLLGRSAPASEQAPWSGFRRDPASSRL